VIYTFAGRGVAWSAQRISTAVNLDLHTSPTSGDRYIGIVRLGTTATEFSCSFLVIYTRGYNKIGVRVANLSIYSSQREEVIEYKR
jgi:hypothetical protein